jgi:hypothetical protein
VLSRFATGMHRLIIMVTFEGVGLERSGWLCGSEVGSLWASHAAA